MKLTIPFLSMLKRMEPPTPQIVNLGVGDRWLVNCFISVARNECRILEISPNGKHIKLKHIGPPERIHNMEQWHDMLYVQFFERLP